MILLFLALFGSNLQAKEFDCKASYDQLGITHQVVESKEQFYYCFGFHHGQDRAWEMDYFRRVGQGRNAEIYGYDHLKSDLMMKLLNLPSLAEKIWSEFPQDKKQLFEQYTAGVNAGFKNGKNNQEFLDKKYVPEAWRPQDSLIILLLQSFDQTRKSFFRDYEEEKSKEHWGNKAAELFDEDNMPWENTILKEGEYQKREVPLSTSINKSQLLEIWSAFPAVFGEETGSNNWVISKNKSKTGNAIFANDPHLDLKTPMFWYWIHLKSPVSNVIGASVPGVPVIASGTNGKVAWGLTNSYLNAADVVFLQDLKEDNTISFRPTVDIKVLFFTLPFFFKTFERLKTGEPILPLETKNKNKLALRWSGFHLKAEDITPMLDIPEVKDVEETDKVLSKIGVPSWNYVFADHKGDIGYRLIGKTFKSTSKTPFGISTQTLEDFRNIEFLSPAERPQVLKPKRDYVYSANNRHWPTDAAFYGGRAYSYSFRGYRIDELLKGQHDTESFKEIQCDHLVVDAKFFMPKIHQNIEAKELTVWNMQATDSSMELPLYRRFMDLMKEKWHVNEYALYKLLGSLTIEQTKEMEDIYNLAKNEVGARSWGEIHRVLFPHLSKNGDWIFSPDIPGVGDLHTVDPGTAQWNEEKKIYEQYSGASMRMIVELGEKPVLLLSLPGLNREYSKKTKASPWESWRKCEYYNVEF